MGSMDGDRASTDLVFVAEESPGGGLTASAVGHSIVTQAENEEELRLMGRDAGFQLARMMRETAAHPERFDDDDVRVFADNIGRPGGLGAMINYYRALVLGGGARRQARIGYPKITTPTLLLWGEQDMALDKACTYGTQAYVAPLTLRYLPGVSHWAQQDDPDTVNAMLEAFLTGAPVPHAPGVDALTGDLDA